MKSSFGICSKCELENPIENDHFNLCRKCNKNRLDKKKVKKPLKKKRPRNSGEKILFLSIWNERPHICTNCKEHLGDEPLAQFFSHRFSKKVHPEYRLDPNFIDLLCFDCHYCRDHQGKEAFDKRTKL